jgi:hypothetical protein
VSLVSAESSGVGGASAAPSASGASAANNGSVGGGGKGEKGKDNLEHLTIVFNLLVSIIDHMVRYVNGFGQDYYCSDLTCMSIDCLGEQNLSDSFPLGSRKQMCKTLISAPFRARIPAPTPAGTGRPGATANKSSPCLRPRWLSFRSCASPQIGSGQCFATLCGRFYLYRESGAIR